MVKSLLLSMLALLCSLPILGNSVPVAEARSGCCSWHGGVCGCGCCDGTSLSVTCAPYYPECSTGYSAPKPLTIDRCSESGLYKTYMEKKSSGETMAGLSIKSWWSKCPLNVRKAVYSKISSPPPTPVDPSDCSGLGAYAIYNALLEQCECTLGTVLRSGKCQTPPYCGSTATYSSQTGQCECNLGYKKSGKQCVAVNCTDNSAYNSLTKTCECFSGFLVRGNKCTSAVELCGYNATYDISTSKCLTCGAGSYLENGTCIQKSPSNSYINPSDKTDEILRRFLDYSNDSELKQKNFLDSVEYPPIPPAYDPSKDPTIIQMEKDSLKRYCDSIARMNAMMGVTLPSDTPAKCR